LVGFFLILSLNGTVEKKFFQGTDTKPDPLSKRKGKILDICPRRVYYIDKKIPMGVSGG